MINRKEQRFYWLFLQQDLLGNWCVHKISGGLHNNHRREQWFSYEDKLSAAKALTELEYQHRQHGYIYADIEDVDYFNLTPQTIEEVITNN